MKYVSLMILVILSATIQAQDIITLSDPYEVGDRITFTAGVKKYMNVKVTTVSDSTIWVTWEETFWDGGTVKKVYLVEIQIEDIDKIVGRLYDNSAYFELGGNGIFWSLNYEHLFALSDNRNTHLAARIGISTISDYVPILSPLLGEEPQVYATFPLELTFLFFWPKSLELGVGYTLMPEWWGQDITFMRIGYRSVKLRNGFLFRVAYTSFVDEGEYIGSIGLTFGKSF